MGRALLKLLAIAVAMLFLGGAVLTAMSDVALAAGPATDGGADSGVERTFFHPTKSAPLPRPGDLAPKPQPR